MYEYIIEAVEENLILFDLNRSLKENPFFGAKKGSQLA
jgi:hypothetical protein